MKTAWEHVERTRKAIHFMCLYSRPRSRTGPRCLSPGKGVFVWHGSARLCLPFPWFSIYFPFCRAVGLNTCLCCRARCDAGGPLVRSWLMDRFPSGHGILPFCRQKFTCAASETSLEKLHRKEAEHWGDLLQFFWMTVCLNSPYSHYTITIW